MTSLRYLHALGRLTQHRNTLKTDLKRNFRKYRLFGRSLLILPTKRPLWATLFARTTPSVSKVQAIKGRFILRGKRPFIIVETGRESEVKMYKYEQEKQDLVNKDRRRNQNTMVDTTEPSDSFYGRQHSGTFVIPAFREIEKMLDADGRRVWIHVEADRTWLTIGHGAKVGGKEECGTTLKYQVDVSGQAMTSSLWQVVDFGRHKERLVGDEHEIAGGANGKSITDITSQDIVDDFMATLEAYAIERTDS